MFNCIAVGEILPLLHLHYSKYSLPLLQFLIALLGCTDANIDIETEEIIEEKLSYENNIKRR